MDGQTPELVERQARELHALQVEMGGVKSVLNKVVETLSRIGVFEERQQQMAHTTNKILDRIEAMEQRQHAADIAAAAAGDTGTRLQQVEKAFLELHIEREKDKARFQTVVWMVRGLWLAAGSSVAGIVYLVNALANNPAAR